MVADAALAPPAFVQLAAHPVRWRLLTELARTDCRVHELVARVSEPQNLVSYHLRLLRDGGLVRASRSSFDGREAYYHLDLDRCADALSESGAALHPALNRASIPAGGADAGEIDGVSVLFVCTGNSARSPMAEALLWQQTGGRVTVTSAGTRPKAAIHEEAVRVLRDVFGIDITGQRPRPLGEVDSVAFDFLVTLCDRAREACPEFPGHPRQIHWSIADPSAAGASAFDAAAAEIDTRVRHLLPILAANASHTQEVQP